jgi:predicted phage terminase large subunit-like protein
VNALKPRQIRPQPGPQEKFLATPADIAVYGGQAGGGKSFALLLEPARHLNNPKFGGVIFRRTSPQLTGAGSLWEEAQSIFRPLGCALIESPTLRVKFPRGGLLQLLHLQHVTDVYDHQGKQYAYIGWDELTHFEPAQFWYLVSRMRSVSGVKPYMRATCNPDPDSFVAELIAWWIGPDGFAIPERSGVIRWFIRRGDTLIWADTRDELLEQCRDGEEPISFTFISARLDDNKALMAADPGYRSRLMALPEVERERLLRGNWMVRAQAGKFILAEWFKKRWTALPPLRVYMASDYAVRELEEDASEPDFTEHGVFGVDANNDLYVIDWWYGQTKPDVWIERLIDKMAKHQPWCVFGEGGVIRRSIEGALVKRMDERKVMARLEWINHPGTQAEGSSKQGFADRSKRAKATRARAFQARGAMGKIIMPSNAEWVDHVVTTCVGFPVHKKDDAFDVMSLMCNVIDQAHPALSGAGESSNSKKKDGYESISEPSSTWSSTP